MFPNIQIWMLPPNTTALIQPIDQGVIMVLKSKVKKIYYDKLVDFNLNTTYNYETVDPFVEFMKTYTILDAIKDVGKAWEEISPELIHKCFEKVFDIPLYLKKRNEKFHTNDEWEGLNFRGFTEESTEINKTNIQCIT